MLSEVSAEECQSLPKGEPFLTAPSVRAWGKPELLHQHLLPALREKSHPEIHLPPKEVFASFPMGRAYKSSIITLISWMEESAVWGGGYAPAVTLWSGGSRSEVGQAGAFSWH